jgi:hypothetical protein
MKRSNREFANSESHAALPNRAALHFHSVPFVSVFSFSCVPQNGHATANTAVPLWQWDLGSALSARHPTTNQVSSATLGTFRVWPQWCIFPEYEAFAMARVFIALRSWAGSARDLTN